MWNPHLPGPKKLSIDVDWLANDVGIQLQVSDLKYADIGYQYMYSTNLIMDQLHDK